MIWGNVRGVGGALVIAALVGGQAPVRTVAPLIRSAETTLDFASFDFRPALQTATTTTSRGVGVAAFQGRAEVLTHPIDVGVEAPEPFIALGVVLNGDGLEQTSVSVRTTRDGLIWEDWRRLEPDADLGGGTTEQFMRLTIVDRGTRQVQYRLTLQDEDARHPTIRSLRSVFISPGASDEPDAPDPGEVRSADTLFQLVVATRTKWGCPDGQTSPRWTPQQTTVTHLVVHHTVDANTATSWPAVMRAIWQFHTVTRGWGDVGYNYLIDPRGLVYEGRAGGAGVIGAHFSCANTNTLGVAFLGTFTSAQPTDAAMDSLVHLLAREAQRHAIDPAGSSFHTPTRLILPHISGHRDANPSTSPTACPAATECPGNALYPQLPAMRARVTLTSGDFLKTAIR